MSPVFAKWIIFAGILIVLAGIIIYFFHDKLHWLGRLPGDVSGKMGNTRFYFPVMTMLIISVLLTIIINIFKRFLH